MEAWNEKEGLGYVLDSFAGFTRPIGEISGCLLALPGKKEPTHTGTAGKAMTQHKGLQQKLSADPVLPGFSLDLSKLLL